MSHAPGDGAGSNVGLRDFCHILTLLPPGVSVVHKLMSCFPRLTPCRCLDRHVKESYDMSMALGARP